MTDPSMKTDSRLRVLHIGKFFPPAAGGIEYFLGDLLPALERFDINAGALVHSHPDDSGDENRDAVHPPVWRVPCFGNLLYTPVSPSFPFWLSRVIKEFRPQLLHFHLPNVSAFWAMAVPAARRIPWIIHWHSDVVSSNIDPRLRIAYRFYRPFEQMLLGGSAAIIATSPPYLNSSPALQKWADKSKVIPLGLDPRRLTDPDPDMLAWAETIWGDTQFRILTVGRLTYYKGHTILIRAMKDMKDCSLVIVGEGEQKESLEKQIQASGLSGCISLPGGLPGDKLHALLATCDCFCLPSVERTEAFGLVLLEAMRYGKALVVSDIPGSGTGWVVQYGKTGLLTAPGDHASLTAALTELQKNVSKREELSKAGLTHFKEDFHIDSVAQKLKDLYVDMKVLS